jgi:L-2,4-diaminobutyric acid acetyltransferase
MTSTAEPISFTEIRKPSPDDAAAIWNLVDCTPVLDDNSPYAYMLLCSHFAETGLVAYRGEELLGFVLGYARPDDHSTAFVWQVAVAEAARGQGLGTRLLDGWFARCARRSDLRWVEATVTPSNTASRSLFESFASRHGAPVQEFVAYESDKFPAQTEHEDEICLRIGPVGLARIFAPTENDPQEAR